MFTILNPVIFMVDRFIGLSDLRSSDKSIKILVDHCKIEIRSSPLPSVQLFTILCHICVFTILPHFLLRAIMDAMEQSVVMNFI